MIHLVGDRPMVTWHRRGLPLVRTLSGLSICSRPMRALGSIARQIRDIPLGTAFSVRSTGS